MMMKTLCSAAALAVALSADGAVAACPDDIDKLRADLRGDKSFQERYTAGRIDRGTYTQLFDAARIFESNGMEQNCQQVLAGIRKLSQEADRTGAAPRARTPQGAQPPSADSPRTGQVPAQRDAATIDDERKRQLRAAKALSEISVSAENLMGVDVRNTSDVDLGNVEDIVMEGGKIKSIVIGRGGFLGLGGAYYEIAPDKAKVATLDATGTRDLDNRIIVLDMSEQQVDGMPKVTKEEGRWIGAADQGRERPPSATPAAPPTEKKN
jgi:hypothetical protein